MDISDTKCSVCGVGGICIELLKVKVCPTCAQNICNIKVDGESDDDNKPTVNALIDALSGGMNKLDMSDDDELFKESPPKEDCSICMLPMPFSEGGCGVRILYQPCSVVCVSVMDVFFKPMKK